MYFVRVEAELKDKPPRVVRMWHKRERRCQRPVINATLDVVANGLRA